MTMMRGRQDQTHTLGRTLRRVADAATDGKRQEARSLSRSGATDPRPGTLAAQQIVAPDFRTAVNVGESNSGVAGVRFTADGIDGYNSSLDKTIDIGTDGSGTLGLGATQITWDTAGVVDVPGGSISAGTIDELQLADEAVTNAKIAVNAIQGDVIAAGAITETKVGSSAISTVKLAAGAVTAAKIAAGTITATEIASNAITAVKIQAGAVTSAKISVSQLDAISADMGSITAGTVTGATLRTASSGDRVQMDTDGLNVVGTSQLIRFWPLGIGGINPMYSIDGASGSLRVSTNWQPSTTGDHDLGSSSLQWDNAYVQDVHTNVIRSLGTDIQIHASAGSNTIGFFGVTPVTRQNVSGSRGGNAALADLITALEDLGLVTDSTT